MTLEAFAIEVDDLAYARSLIPAWETYYPTPEAWRAQWEGGMTPREALDQDLSAGAMLLEKFAFQQA